MKDQHRRHLPHIEPGIRSVFITFCTRGRWKLPEPARDIVLRHLVHDHGVRFHLHGAVVMPDHVHMVITPLPGDDEIPLTLAAIMSGIKGASAHSINKSLNRRGAVWQDESFDRILRTQENIREKVETICQNPVRAGLVLNEDDTRWLWREWVEGS